MRTVEAAKPANRQVLNWAAVVLWAGIIFYLSSLPKLGMRNEILLIPKLAHVAEYAVLTLLLIRALASQGLPSRRAVWIAVLVAFAYACTDEFHQSFVPRRHSSPLDILVDSIGIAAAAWWRS